MDEIALVETQLIEEGRLPRFQHWLTKAAFQFHFTSFPRMFQTKSQSVRLCSMLPPRPRRGRGTPLYADKGYDSHDNRLSFGLPKQESIANLFRQLGVDLVEEKPPGARN